MDLFDAYFRLADLDRDGRISGNEDVAFFPKQVLAHVLYKNRCDNCLNEITERASADRREEKKMELYRAIVKMEQEGDADGTLQFQDRVDHIQLDLDGLVKTLNERCKKYGLHRKHMRLTELPFGWQPGIQEGAADWNEDWDKFEDEGFTFV